MILINKRLKENYTMGQYYIAASIDTKKCVHPFGAKLMEHSWINNDHMLQVQQLLSPGNPWHKTRIVWTGDYSDTGLFTEDPERNLYDLASDEFENISNQPTVDGPQTRYIVNHTKNMYLDLLEVPDSGNKQDVDWQKGWKIHPLSILTSSGNGRGGGDYRDYDDENVGSWAGDVISCEYEAPVGMEKFTAFFTKD
jgi:hypothetical protein